MINGVQASGAGHARPTAQDIFKKLDTNGDGSIDVNELSASGKHGKGDGAQAKMAKFDTNGDGKIDASENAAAFAKMEDAIKNHVHGRHKGAEGGAEAGADAGAQSSSQSQDLKSLLDMLKQKSADGDSGSSDALIAKLQADIQSGTQYTDSGSEKCSVQQGALSTHA